MSSFNTKEYQSLVLAALLHDVGKFMQRAEASISARSKGMESTICPVYHGRYSHRHVLWTNEFFEFFQNHPILGMTLEKDSISNLASFHHRPETKLQKIVQLADWLSSGSERVEDEEPSDDRENYKKARMHSILEYMFINENKMTEPQYRYELKPLDGDAMNCFSQKLSDLNPREGEKLVESYGALWNSFRPELEGLGTESADKFTVSLLSLLEKYTWCIPSSTMHRPDISLYDHAKTSSAIAAALYLYHAEKEDIDSVKFSVDDDDKKFILLSGDISGIQNYIFNIKNVGLGGTAKRLRARSFYLSAISDVASHKLLHAFGLSVANLLMSSGGKFYLFLPNIGNAEAIIGKIQAEFDVWCMKELNGEIGLNIAREDFSCRELMEFSKVMEKVNTKLQQAKNRPFHKHLSTKTEWNEVSFIFEENKFDSEESLCVSCGKFAGQLRVEQQIVMCGHCFDDVQLGQKLTNACGVQFFADNTNGKFKIFDYSFTIVRGESPELSKDAYLVYQFNNWRLGNRGVALKPKYFANHIPVFATGLCNDCGENVDCKDKSAVRVGMPKFFSCLAEASQGRKMLGIFKADVDNLGLLFIKGFRTDKEKSIARVTTLSRMLDTFFTGRLDYLLREEFPNIYTVYAGGDDLLVLGPWDQTISFGVRLRKEFQEYCCHNPDFTLSAGISVVKPKLPVYASVKSADELLEKAKHEKSIGAEKPKNQLAVLGDFFKWEKAETILMEAERLKEWQAGKKVSTGFVRQLLDSGEMHKYFEDTKETRYLRFIPLLAYSMKRNVKDDEIVRWSQDLLARSKSNVKLNNLTFIANYSITMNRS